MSGITNWYTVSNGIIAAKDTVEGATQHVEEHAKEEGFDPVKPDTTMFFLTWGIFLALLLVLYKVAWKPILTGLNEREDKIRQSIEDAEKATTELKEVQENSKKLLQEADAEAKSIVSKARETAQTLSKEIEEKAKSEAQSVRDNALKDIESAKVEAMQSLRNESAELAIELAGKLLGENLDNEKNRTLTEKLISKI
ncbi:MAG: F0F1 ATP synthase subunit B [Lentisphaeraceae bacterium]|nr:F0F1 ATP synthase subunit B [Lentisphaeraceae bacterium]